MEYKTINYQTLHTIVKKAGTLLLQYFTTSYPIHKKPDRSVYTEADIACETFLKHHLQKIFPASIWAEESGKIGNEPYCWVIDPIDGTNNYIRQLPYFCISVALTRNNEPVIAIVYQPITDELFFATKDSVTTCNEKPVSASQKNSFSNAMIGVSSWGGLQEDAIVETMKKYSIVRRHGALALDLAYVSSGKLDALVYQKAYWWDIAAGILLIQQAGGNITPIKTIAKTGLISGGIVAGKKLFDLVTKKVAKVK